MMVIKALGPGCKNCERLEMHADQAVEQIQAENPKLEITVKKVTDVDSFLDYGLLRLQAITHGGQLLNVAI